MNFSLYNLFPWHYCNLCKTPCRHIICNTCLNELEQINESCCNKCLKSILPIKKTCSSCDNNPPYFDQIYSTFNYKHPLNKILHLYKYKKHKKYYLLLSYLLQFNDINFDQYDIIIPMPTHINRIKQRGFDHIELLLSYWLMDDSIKNKIKFNTLTKLIDTEHQALNKLPARQHQANNIYKACYDFTNLKILVIDDVVTTGNTLNNLARFLKENGAIKVDCCSIMRTTYTN